MTTNHWRWLSIAFALLFGAVYLYPSVVFYSKPRQEQRELRERRNPIVEKIINLGLDLQGGIHLLLELETDKLPDDRPATVREAQERAIEVIRNRIDAIGVAEPLIVAQGNKWIVSQLPGLTNREQAKMLIGQTALLEFRLVEPNQNMGPIVEKLTALGVDRGKLRAGQTPEDVKKLLPAGTELLAGKDGALYVVKAQAEMTGSSLANARVELGSEYNAGYPTVALEFNPEGAKRFAEVTEANIQRQLAIVLDGIVQSAPVIRSRIPDGHAVIEGNFTPEDAKLLKTVLQAGALPVPLRLIEERTVGPTLGDDSIRAGMTACAIGLALVFVFMGIYYRWSGMLANVALLVNLLLLLASMAAIHATLTMPGIAGIILSLGMAVDANVLILERSRDELRLGKTPRLAVEQGYDRAFSAIFDGNLTTIIAAMFLFQFGTGPVKGFGITLILGLIVSMFTAIVMTRAVYDSWMSRWPVQKLSI